MKQKNNINGKKDNEIMNEEIEYLDVVNERNEVIGKDTKDNCHKLKLIHRNVHIFIFNKNEELLLQVRNKSGFYNKMYTSSSSGHVTSGETYLESAKRELSEEIGIKKIDLEYIGDFKMFNSYEKCLGQLFMGECNTEEKKYKIDKNEVSSVKYFSIEKIKQMIIDAETLKIQFSPNFLECFKIYCDKYGK